MVVNMIKKLQRKLTFLYTFTTGIILTLVVIAISVISQLNLSNKMDENFQNHVMSISAKLQTDAFFNISWIAAMESQNHLLIHIEENGKPLLYQSSWNPPSGRNNLIRLAKEQAKNLNTDISVSPVSSPSISPIFTLTGLKKDQYKGIAVSYPAPSGFKSMILLYDISPAQKTLQMQRYLFMTAAILGIAALYFASRRFVKNATKPLQISNRKQQEFIAAASHELRSPLMVIQSSVQAIETVPEKTMQFTENIRKECTRMTHLVNDMLTLASLDTKNWSAAFETLDPNTLVIELYERYEPLCLESGVPFHLTLPDEMIPAVIGDKERLFQILTILLDNALAYNIDRKPITLEASVIKSWVCIQIIDHGPGIPDSEKELIFDRFFRSDKSRKDKQHFGLGLSIARELTSLHNGSLHVKDSVGGGCTFVLKVPFVTHS